MSLDISTDRYVCYKCGKSYPKRKGYYHASYSQMSKGIGFLPVCRNCVDEIYLEYLNRCNSARMAVRQLCRKLDLYWDDYIFELVAAKSTDRTVHNKYIQKLSSTPRCHGKSYDNSLLAEGALWDFGHKAVEEDEEAKAKIEAEAEAAILDATPVSDEIRMFWGTGYTNSMYRELETRREYWMSKFPDDYELDIGTEAIIRQICSLELDINRDRAAGKPIDKYVNSLNTLLGSANLKPAQKKSADMDAELTKVPMGVWLYRFENKRPLPEVDDDCKDVNHLRKYIFTWMGHLCKMLGLKNAYAKLYEDEIERLRVEKPEYDGDDDEAFLLEYMEENDEPDILEMINNPGGDDTDGQV